MAKEARGMSWWVWRFQVRPVAWRCWWVVEVPGHKVRRWRMDLELVDQRMGRRLHAPNAQRSNATGRNPLAAKPRAASERQKGWERVSSTTTAAPIA